MRTRIRIRSKSEMLADPGRVRRIALRPQSGEATAHPFLYADWGGKGQQMECCNKSLQAHGRWEKVSGHGGGNKDTHRYGYAPGGGGVQQYPSYWEV